MISWHPLLPLWLIALLIGANLAAVVVALRRANPLLSPARQRLLAAVRLLAIAGLAAVMLCPGTLTEQLNAERSRLVFLLDTSASMAMRDMPLEHSRFEAASRFLRELNLNDLADYPQHFYSFADTATPWSPKGPPAGQLPAGGTLLKEAIATIDKDVGLANLAAVVMVGDALDHSGFAAGDLAVPIYAVKVGTSLEQARDLGFGEIKPPAKVSVGDEIDLEVPILLTGFAQPQTVAWRALVNDRELLANSVDLLPGVPASQRLTYRFAEEGIHLFELELAELPDEAGYLNNRRILAVEAVRARYEILAYFPILTTSFRAIVREFEVDEENSFTACCQIAPGRFLLRGNRLNQAFRDGLPSEIGPLRNLDCVVLAATNGELLTAAEVELLEQYVASGGTLVLLGGADSFGPLADGTPLAAMLPVATMHNSFSDTPFAVLADDRDPTPFGRQVEAIVADLADDDGRLMKGLNTVADVKPGARVLLWADTGHRQPLLVWQPYGKGKVVALLTNAIHTWGRPARREQVFRQFWRQLVAFARRTDDADDQLRVALAKADFHTDEPLTVTATVAAEPPAAADRKLVADLFAGDRLVQSLELQPAGNDSFRGDFPPLAAGRYALRVQLQEQGEVIRQRFRLVLVGDPLLESSRVATSDADFRRFSPATRTFTLEQGEELVRSLHATVRQSRVERERFLPFETPIFLILIVAALLLEWTLRRRFNLF